MKRQKIEHYHGCNQDCFNCKYSDCRLPDRGMPIDKDIELTSKKENKRSVIGGINAVVEIDNKVKRIIGL